MSMKRQATTELNHDNWDQEDPPETETMGRFKSAPKEELQKRVIRTAKRRSLASAAEQNKSPFGAFSGFKKAAPSSFDFLANLTNGATSNGGTTAENKSTNLFEKSINNTELTSTPGKADKANNFMTSSNNNNLFSSTSQTSLFTTANSDDKTATTSPGFSFKMNNSGESQHSAASNSPSTLNSASSNLFSSNVTPTTTSNTVFGTPKSSTLFSSATPTTTTNNSVFGSAKLSPTATISNSVFGSAKESPTATTSNSVFGSAKESPTATTSNPVFGSTKESNSSLFSSTNSKPVATTNAVFGSTKGTGSTLFSGTNKSPVSTKSLVFGTTQNANSSSFSAASSASATTTNSLFGNVPSTLFTPSQLVTGSKESPFKITSTPTFSNSSPEIPFKTSTVGSMPTQVSSSVFGTSNKSLFTITSTSSETRPTNSFHSNLQKSQETNTKSRDLNISNDKSSNTENNITNSKLDHLCFAKLKALNQSVTAWIKKHVDETPCCILTPIFKDYEEHLKKIQEEFSKGHPSESTSFGTNTLSAINTSIFTGKQAETKDKSISQTNKSSPFTITTSKTESSTFSFGIKPSPSKPETSQSTGFSFGIKPASTSVETPLATATTKTSPNQSANTNFSFSSNTSNESLVTGNIKTSPSTGFSFGIKPTTSNNNPLSSSSAGNTLNSSFTFGVKPISTNSETLSTPSTKTTSSGFSFGIKPVASNSSVTTPINSSVSANSSSDKEASKPFSFNVGKPFSFNSNTIEKPAESDQNKENDEDEPPKVEYTPIVEENSVFEKKCKVFVKKDGNFSDRGVGTLFIKKIEESGKHQILVRANNNLGTILLNFILSSGIPTQRMGKNNVMLVCIPTPDSKPPPTPILIRVKTSEEADNLLEELNKYKS